MGSKKINAQDPDPLKLCKLSYRVFLIDWQQTFDQYFGAGVAKRCDWSLRVNFENTFISNPKVVFAKVFTD